MKNIGIIGCGNILETYLRSENYFNNLNFTSCADINMDLAAKSILMSAQDVKFKFLK